jgi:hypothetical protein
LIHLPQAAPQDAFSRRLQRPDKRPNDVGLPPIKLAAAREKVATFADLDFADADGEIDLVGLSPSSEFFAPQFPAESSGKAVRRGRCT